ncbi:MAG: leucyl aminopeptidase [Deltaproteobacteria bacterium]|nr:leucyl aminopeptidase [Deltaproteobacteria bacterium]MBW2659124.1 leucyl aminopeptidase [Deltaproteobacteria bacterium]
MKNTKVIISKDGVSDYSGDLLICLTTINKDDKLSGADFIQPEIDSFQKKEEFSGKKGEGVVLYPPFNTNGTRIMGKRVLLLGTGKIDDIDSTNELRELFRSSGGIIADFCRKTSAENPCIVLHKSGDIKLQLAAEYLTEGVLLGDYSFKKYKINDDDKKQYPGIKKLLITAPGQISALKKNCRRAVNSAFSTVTARDMANEPGNGWTPDHFARHAEIIAKNHKLKCRIIEKSEMITLGMGGILAVNQGSVEPPKLVILEYRPKKKSDTILMIGKGLTFDSGGVSLKPAAGMMDMKYDMCGGAAVISAMETIAREKPDVGVVAMIPSTDNMSGADALKPGDIITHYGGITSEIENTDAEGRLILADAMAYGIEQYKPTCVIDLATLTGAVIIALGHHRTGILGTNDYLVKSLTRAGSICGEPLWRLPLGEEYSKQIDSEVADIKNTGGKPGGTITAAAYLQKFAGDVPWAHLDIAGTAWDFTKKTYIPKGPSGTGVRTLIELVRRWKNGQIKK